MVDDKQQKARMIQELLSRARAEESFYEFCKQAWHLVEGDNPFMENWHLVAICEHLEALVKRQIRNLLINMPPRSGKSSLISVLFPAWVWINHPEERFLYASYSHLLAIRDSIRCRRVIEAPWYQQRWSDKYTLLGDQNNKVRYDNNMSGFRLSASQKAATGDGGSIAICMIGDTSIITENGRMRIDDIVESKINVKVLTFNHQTNETELKEIEAYEKNPGQELIEIDLGDRVIYCTEDHPIWIEERGYIRASDIQMGDIVRCV